MTGFYSKDMTTTARLLERQLPTVILACALALAASPSRADLLGFSYTQDDLTTGSGTISGFVDGVFYEAALPDAEIAQLDSQGLTVPDGMVGYIGTTSGTAPLEGPVDHGVYMGWNGATGGPRDPLPEPLEVTLTGMKQISVTEFGLFELDVPLLIAANGSPGGGWSYAADLTDDDGMGNDAVGTTMRVAGWVGDKGLGHRHSGPTRAALSSGVDTYSANNGPFNGADQVDSEAWGDNLGLNYSYRNATWDPASGPIFIDRLAFTGSVDVDPATNPGTQVDTLLVGDFDNNDVVDLADYNIFLDNFFLADTDLTTGDLNFDGETSLADFSLFRASFNELNPGGAAVPEPSTFLLMGLGAMLAMLTRMRRR